MAAPAPLPALVLAGYDPAPLHTRPSAAPATLPGNTNLPGNTALTGHKALLELNGRPLVAYTLDALRGSPRVGAITVVGFERAQCDLGGGLSYLPNQPSLVENGLHGLRTIAAEIPEGTHVLVTGSDAPLLSAEAITWFVDACTPWSADLYLGVASQATIEARFPASKRTCAKGAFAAPTSSSCARPPSSIRSRSCATCSPGASTRSTRCAVWGWAGFCACLPVAPAWATPTPQRGGWQR
jgi:hypothetical protein